MAGRARLRALAAASRSRAASPALFDSLVVRDYPLAALGGVDPRVLSVGLVELTSGFWMDIDGEGGEIVAMTPQALRIRQTRAVHDELQSLFDQIAAATGGRGRVLTAQGKAEQAMIRKLQTPAQFSTDKTALPELLDQLLQKNGIPFWIDQTALADEGIDWTKLESTVAVKKLSPAARLDAIVTEHQLAWRFADEVVQITTEVKSNERLFTRVYDIRRSNQPGPVLAQQLMQNPDLGPWVVNDGEGGGILPVGTLLLVRQSAKVHARIAKLLN